MSIWCSWQSVGHDEHDPNSPRVDDLTRWLNRPKVRPLTAPASRPSTDPTGDTP